jgi:Bacterial Ig-like domain
MFRRLIDWLSVRSKSYRTGRLTRSIRLHVESLETRLTPTVTLPAGVGDLNLSMAPIQAKIVALLNGTAPPSISASLSNDTGTSATDTNTSDPTIHGTATSINQVVVLRASMDANANASDIFSSLTNGSFTLNSAALQSINGASLADGAHTLHLFAQDAIGSAAIFNLAFTLDTTAPTFTAGLSHDTGDSATDGITSDPTISGQVTDNIAATIFLGSFDTNTTPNVDIKAQLDTNGNYTLNAATLQTINGGTALPDGAHTLHLLAKDAAGNTTSHDVAFTLDRVNPTLSAHLQNDTGTANDGITSDPTITGQATDTNGVHVLLASFDAQTTPNVDVSTQLGSGGSFTLNLATLQTVNGGTLPDGAHTLHLLAKDTAGNSVTFNVSFTLRATALLLTGGLANDTGTSNIDGITNDPTISGSVTTDSTATVTALLASFDTVTTPNVDVLARVQSGGSFTLDADTLKHINGDVNLANGQHTLHLLAHDSLGNATILDIAFTLDATNPSLTAALSNDTGASTSDGLTADPTITGTATDNVAVTVFLGSFDTVTTPTVDILNKIGTGGAVTLDVATLNTINGSTLTDGPHTLHLIIKDAAGNSATKDVAFTLDRTVPSVTAALHTDTGASGTDGITSDPTISGQATDTTGITAFVASFDTTTNPTFSILDQIGSGGSFTLNAAKLKAINGDVDLTEGSHTLHLRALDGAGNATTRDVVFTLDATAPDLSAGLANDTGTANDDGVTSDPTITGHATDANGISAFVASFDTDTTPHVNILGTIGTGGVFTLDVTTLNTINGSTLGEGQHTLHLLATDTAGITTPLDVTFTLDKTNPSLTAALSNDTGTSSSDGITADPTIAGQVSDNRAVTVLLASFDTQTTPNVDILNLVNAGGSFTLNATTLKAINGDVDLSDGVHTLHLRARDAAGNTTNFDVAFTLDTTTPVLTAGLANDTGTPNDGITSDPTISGNVTDNVGVTGFLASFDAQTTPNVDIFAQIGTGGAFTLDAAALKTINGDVDLADGAHTLHLRAVDAAGNPATTDVAFALQIN